MIQYALEQIWQHLINSNLLPNQTPGSTGEYNHNYGDRQTTMNSKNWTALPITTILAGVYPFFFYWSVNANQVSGDQVWRAFVVVCALSLLLLLSLRLILGDFVKANIIGTILLMSFLSYGHVFTWLKSEGVPYVRHSTLLAVFVLCTVALIWLTLTRSRRLASLVGFLNIIFLSLLLMSIFPIVRAYSSSAQIDTDISENNVPVTPKSDLPDIYLIVVDEYPRADVLKNSLGFDNSSFLGQLSALGFRVFPCSQSNYRWTIQSLYAMLNLEYAPPDTLKSVLEMDNPEINTLSARLKNSKLLGSLKANGYQIVSFESGYYFAELTNADVYFQSPKGSEINPFENGFMETTMLSATDDLLTRLGIQTGDTKAKKLKEKEEHSRPEYYYQMKKKAYDHLEQASQVEGRKFIFAHLMTVHKPIVIGENSELLSGNLDQKSAYLSQLQYANSRILESMRFILESSDKKPIIILLSDHGLRFDGFDFDLEDNPKAAFDNLLAVYGPEDYQNTLYETITPVNVMRSLANYLKLGSFAPIADTSFYPDPENNTITVLPNTCLATP